jgi:predicted Zn-dependent protease
MFFFRALVGLAATAAVVMAGVFVSKIAFRQPQPVAQLTFGEAMQNLAKQKSYQARIRIEDDEYHLVAYENRAFRIDHTPTNYTIATREHTIEVEETENRATKRDWPYYTPELDLLDPLRLWAYSSADLRDVRPLRKEVVAGREQFVYFYDPGNPYSKLEALVDARTRLPTSIRGVGDRRGQVMPFDMHFTVVDEPLDPAKLRVAATLTEDGRVGKATDVQGLVSVRPRTSTRWTPVCGDTVLFPGDWIRTDFQGPNAVTLELAPSSRVILGPGSLLEIDRPDRLTLHAGVAEFSPAAKSETFSGVVHVTGPNRSTLDIGGVQLVRTSDQGLVTSDKTPAWLAGYKGTTAQPSLGSLVALIDGRQVQLSVGYHHVDVEIRDQIARTTIEQSFVNNTGEVLEGQFHFPLPADASISGFGIWIGNELVEADVVEKQRAREIYETILREKRDPGLLEWSGGNLFKARVYPIPARSEKRIKIVYTQVLPRRGGSYRYSYPLQSDLLRQNPLRELNLAVTVQSTQPIAKIQSPTHDVRTQLAAHAARVEFSAQTYTPSRDFEVVVETEPAGGGQQPAITFIPHRRGDDGYFLLQIEPPPESGAWQRDVLPDGEPLDLVIVADTSASLSAADRQVQSELVAALLGSLAPDDKFNLAVCDVDCTWLFEEPQPAGVEPIAAARQKLAERRSLGWTNLDRMTESLAGRIGQGTQVVYLGDGVVTTGDMDGPAFVQRLQQQFGSKGATLHAIALGSSYDAAVLRGMASIGGGSLRQISGEVGPQQAAKDLLAEIARPSLRNIQLDFQGLRTARVYPRTLPNVPTGQQQIVLGRYLPEGNEEPGSPQQGEVIVTGTLDGKLVTYRAAIDLSGARGQGAGGRGRGTEDGGQSATDSNVQRSTSDVRPSTSPDVSFIPRLWARMHLDELLAQGTSQEIQDEIINLSEEFHIITPYTSLLVLETDADRERFKVKRRFQMSDGERFFADARDTAQYQLVQQQMLQARLWRAGLRQQVLAQLAGWGRDVDQIEAVQLGGPVSADFEQLISLIDSTITPESWEFAGGPGSISSFSSNLSLSIAQSQVTIQEEDRHPLLRGSLNMNSIDMSSLPFDDSDYSRGNVRGWTGMVDKGANAGEWELAVDGAEPYVHSPYPVGEEAEELLHAWQWGNSVSGKGIADEYKAGNRIQFLDFDADAFAGEGFIRQKRQSYDGTAFFGKRASFAGFSAIRGERMQQVWELGASAREQERLVAPIFPVVLPAAPRTRAEGRQRPSTWPADVRELVAPLKTQIDLAALAGAIVVDEQHDSLDEHRGIVDSRTQTWRLASVKAWLTSEAGNDRGPVIHWARGMERGGTELGGEERGVLSVPYELALVRKAESTDFPAELDLGEWWQRDFSSVAADKLARLERPADGTALVILTDPLRPAAETRITIDTTRHIATSIEHVDHGRLVGGTRLSDFIEIAGLWLPQRIEHYGASGQNHNIVTRQYEVVSAERAGALVDERLQPQAAALTVQLPLPALDEARKLDDLGQATLEARLTLLLHLAADQKWPEAAAELDRVLTLAPDKAFRPWLQMWLLAASRRNEELRQLVLTQARELAAQPRIAPPHIGQLELAERLRTLASNFSAAEQLEIVDRLQPVYARLPDHLQGPRLWGSLRAYLLEQMDREDEALRLREQLLSDYPADGDNVRQLADLHIRRGDDAAAERVLQTAIANEAANWSAVERDRLYARWCRLLQDRGCYSELIEVTGQWMASQPASAEPYERHVAALVLTGREAEADQLTDAWLDAGLAPPPLAEAVKHPLHAAIETAIGGNGYLSIDESSQPETERQRLVLARLMKLLAVHLGRTDCPEVESRLSHHWRLRRTEAFRRTAAEQFARLKQEAATLPDGQLVRLFDWCDNYSDEATSEDWQALAAPLRERWLAATHPTVERELARLVLRIARRADDNEPQFAFLRERLGRATDPDERAARTTALFDALLNATWTTDVEAESFALLDKLSAADDAGQRLQVQVAALYRWTDRMEAARFELLESQIEAPEKLTRTELAEKRESLRKQVLRDLATRLADATAQAAAGLQPWLVAERLTLEVRLERDIVENAWELLESVPAGPEAKDVTIADQLQLALRVRLVRLLMKLAAAENAAPETAERLLAYFDKQIAAPGDNAALGLDARLAKYQLLVALDRPEALAEQLAIWSRGTDRPEFWQRSLAYVQAELGKLAEAVALLQPLAAADALSADDYRALARWHQALKQDAEYHRSLAAAWRQLDEWRLRDLVRQQLRPWQNTSGPSPGALDPQLFDILTALFAKAQSPHHHVSHVRELYEASRDFRLLAALAEAVVGQSAGKVYPFLVQLDRTLDVVDREATAGELLASIAQVRERAATPVDRRALDLLEMLVERRAAELLNQPGPHVERAAGALSRAMQHEWTAGEAREMARMLADLGAITQPVLSERRAAALRELLTRAAGDPPARLSIAHALAESLRDDGQREQAILELEPALAEHREASGGQRTQGAIDSLFLLASLYEAGGSFVQAENRLAGELPQAANPGVARSIRQRIVEVHLAALISAGRTSLGEGRTLYEALRDSLAKQAVEAKDQDTRRHAIDRWCRTLRIAKDHTYLVEAGTQPGVDAVAFGREQFPAIIAQQIDGRQDLVHDVAHVIRHTAGPREGLAFYLTQIENEPAWLARRGDDGWRSFAHDLARWANEDGVKGNLGDLEPRLLAIVLDQLRRELRTQNNRRREFAHRGYSYFWKEKTDDFARVAEEVLAEQPDSLTHAMFIANYLHDGIDRPARAIEILLAMHRRKLLDRDGTSQLIVWLQQADRYGESIALLEPLVERDPDMIRYRVLLLNAYFRTEQPAALQTLLAATEEHFRDGRWNEHVAYVLGESCLENRLFPRAIHLYGEAIAMRREALGGRVPRERTLAQYLVDRAYAHLGENATQAAVDDACEAIVVWGISRDGIRRRNFRTDWQTGDSVHLSEVLRDVLTAAPDLPAYIAALDKQVETEGQDRPIVRQLLGEVLLARGEAEAARAQLAIARDLEPNNQAILNKLIAAYDALEQPVPAAEQVFAAATLARRNLDLWANLADRLEKLEQPAEAERARTTLVEVMPQETEGHSRLAEIRQKQDRWTDAAVHWQHVARLRSLEPTGLLRLAAAELHLKDQRSAAATIRQIDTTAWPARFEAELKEQLPKLRAELEQLDGPPK